MRAAWYASAAWPVTRARRSGATRLSLRIIVRRCAAVESTLRPVLMGFTNSVVNFASVPMSLGRTLRNKGTKHTTQSD
jgi:hypothetical protein